MYIIIITEESLLDAKQQGAMHRFLYMHRIDSNFHDIAV